MDVSSIFSSDSPFKFFFLSGIVLLVIGLYYPYEKRTSLDLKKNEVELRRSRLTKQVLHLTEDIKGLNEKSAELIRELKMLTDGKKDRPKSTDSISRVINEKKNSFNQLVELVGNERHQLDLKAVEVDYSEKEIAIYESHLKEVRRYAWIFFISGLLLAIYGGTKWHADYKRKSTSSDHS